ncbi:hypothetical protein E4T56_gene6318 [Termitomyces sp. T112]|nr:hypothetical protein E4T56_gene6318 [Termitomyces sp. T112]
MLNNGFFRQPPTTPESQRQQARNQRRLEQLQMTDPDNCQANRNNRSLEQINTVVVPPLQLGPGGINQSMGTGGLRPIATASGPLERPIRQAAAADDPFFMVILETVLPEGWDAPLQNPIPRVVPPLPALIQRRGNRVNQSALAQAVIVIPETVLPEGWDAPLQNALPRMVPSAPAPTLKRVRPNAYRETMENHPNQQQHALAALQEQQRLRHIAMVEEQKRQQQALAILHQERLREEKDSGNRNKKAEVYQGVVDVAAGDEQVTPQSHHVILPSSHTGSDQQMQQLFQDSMAICRNFGKPDLFLTMTANPKWSEIEEALLKEPAVNGKKQTAADRPDIVARVFELKKNAVVKEIKEGLFGSCVAYVHTIEFQKRGLPHMHILIFFHCHHRIKDAPDVDSIVSAQIPDLVTQPQLYQVVTTNMVHGPCAAAKPNAKCMVDGKCSKKYPKEFQKATQYGDNGYHQYARPDNGCFFEKNAKYTCHINVEVCASVEAIKYIQKYIYKGHDRTTLEIGGEQMDQRDEIKEHLDARYISAPEACWHIFEFNMHGEHPPVYQLPVHLEGQHEVYFQDNEPLEMVAARPNANKTALTAWFEANARFPNNNTTYQNFPIKFVYEASKRTWKERQRGTAIGRMYFASPQQGERFYLRMLLTVVTNATSWADLRTVNGHTYPTYKEACKALGLLEDDAEWRQCLAEAAPIQSGSALRQLFCTILFHCAPTTPEALWDEFRHSICDDL